jgi:excisionase family DNA binding protein
VTLIEAAAILWVTAATLRQQVANGRLRAVKRGRDWHVTPREVERYRRDSLRHLTGALRGR